MDCLHIFPQRHPLIVQQNPTLPDTEADISSQILQENAQEATSYLSSIFSAGTQFSLVSLEQGSRWRISQPDKQDQADLCPMLETDFCSTAYRWDCCFYSALLKKGSIEARRLLVLVSVLVNSFSIHLYPCIGIDIYQNQYWSNIWYWYESGRTLWYSHKTSGILLVLVSV